MKVTIKSFRCKQEYYNNRKGEPFKHSDKIYIWLDNESVLENLMNRRSRPYKMYKDEIIPLLLEEIKTKHPEFYEGLKNTKWGWRQKCGCSCPCSPGFVGSTNGMVTISVTVVVEE